MCNGLLIHDGINNGNWIKRINTCAKWLFLGCLVSTQPLPFFLFFCDLSISPSQWPVSICKCRDLFGIWCGYWCRGKFKWNPSKFISDDDWSLLAIYIVIYVKIYIAIPWSPCQRLDTFSFGDSIKRTKRCFLDIGNQELKIKFLQYVHVLLQ